MSDAGSESGEKPQKSLMPKGDQSRQAESQIRNLDNTVKRLHQQRSKINTQLAEDGKELDWINKEIKAWEEKRRRVMQTKQDHMDQANNIARTNADGRNKLDNELLATARDLVAATKKARRNLEKAEYVPKHKATMK